MLFLLKQKSYNSVTQKKRLVYWPKIFITRSFRVMESKLTLNIKLDWKCAQKLLIDFVYRNKPLIESK